MSVSNVTTSVQVPNLQALFGNTAPKDIDIHKIFKCDPQKWSYNGHGYTQTAPNGMTVYVTQPSGAGDDIFITVTDPKSGMSVTWNAGDVKGTLQIKDIDVQRGGTVNGMNAKQLEEFITEMFLSTEHNGPGGKKRKGNGQAGGNQGNGATGGAAGGANGAGMLEGGVLDPADWAGAGESWFVQMAIAMGEIIKNRALELKGLLEQIKAAGDDPPQKLAMEFQGKTQEMQFLMNAFSTALNALGDTIKKALEQAR
jgi:uncharacterized protein YukE